MDTDIIEQLIKKARKEMQKLKVQVKGLASMVESSEKRTQVQEESQQEVDQAKQSLLKNSSELKASLKGNFANKVSETFEKQKDTLENI